MPSSKSDLHRIVSLLQPHRSAFIGAAAFAGLIATCKGTLIWLIQEVLNSLLVTSDPRAVWLLPATVVLLFAVQGAARVGRTLLTRRAALQAEQTLRRQIFDHLLAQDPAGAQEAGLGDAISRLSHDAGKIRTAVGAAVTLIQRPLSAVAIASTAIVMAPHLALWALLGIPVAAGVITRVGRSTRQASERQLRSLSSLLSIVRDSLGGLRTVQAYGAQASAKERFDEANSRQVRAALHTDLLRSGGPAAVELVAAAGIACVIILGGLEVRAGQLSPGSLVAFLVALGLLNEPLKGIAVATTLWEEARGGLSRVFDLLDRPSQDSAAAGSAVPQGPKVELELERVSAQRGETDVLADLSTTFGPGEIIVIQGPSGAGKSTLLDVLVGFVAPSSGRVLWNGVDAQTLSLTGRRRCISLVDQEPWLGTGTIADAVRMGRPDADDAAVTAALNAVGLALDPDRSVGDGGSPVSGGERQRIALARALIRDASVILLDEPTAGLDAHAERHFLRSLAAEASDRTVLLVTHRPAPAEFATQLLQLVDGRFLQSHSEARPA